MKPQHSDFLITDMCFKQSTMHLAPLLLRSPAMPQYSLRDFLWYTNLSRLTPPRSLSTNYKSNYTTKIEFLNKIFTLLIQEWSPYFYLQLFVTSWQISKICHVFKGASHSDAFPQTFRSCQLQRLERFSTMSRYSVRTGGPYLSLPERLLLL